MFIDFWKSYHTLLGSGSEWPKDQALLLKIVSYKKNWRAALTGHGQSSQLANFWKIAKLALFNPCMKLVNFIPKVHMAPPKCLSKWMKVDNCDYFQNGSQIFFLFSILISFIFLNMKPLSEVAPGLLVIQIQIQAVWPPTRL